MDNAITVDGFSEKFSQLSEQNQRYILAIQQALLFAQKNEKAEKEEKGKRTGK